MVERSVYRGIFHEDKWEISATTTTTTMTTLDIGNRFGEEEQGEKSASREEGKAYDRWLRSGGGETPIFGGAGGLNPLFRATSRRKLPRRMGSRRMDSTNIGTHTHVHESDEQKP